MDLNRTGFSSSLREILALTHKIILLKKTFPVRILPLGNDLPATANIPQEIPYGRYRDA
ncbi:MAG: hypothetical protein Q7T80_11620 [Methanoregula sp.]|nr:hypothetical protein [Methanoregula sp.]